MSWVSALRMGLASYKLWCTAMNIELIRFPNVFQYFFIILEPVKVLELSDPMVLHPTLDLCTNISIGNNKVHCCTAPFASTLVVLHDNLLPEFSCCLPTLQADFSQPNSSCQSFVSSSWAYRKSRCFTLC